MRSRSGARRLRRAAIAIAASLVLGLGGPAAWAGRRGWDINPPAEYAEATAAALQMPELQAMQRKLVEGTEAHEIREYLGSSGGMILAVWVRVGAGAAEAALDRWDSDLRASLTNFSEQFEFRRHIDRTAVVLEAAAGIRGGRRAVLMRSIAGRTADGGLRATMALCVDSAQACDRALASLTLDRKGLVPVLESDLAPVDGTRPAGRRTGRGLIDTKSKAYQYGSVAGAVFVVALVLLWLRTWRRSRRG